MLGGRTETEHAEIVYPREKPAEEVERLRRDVEFRLAQLAQFFGAPPASVRVYVFRSPEEKQRWVGAGGTQFAKPWLGSVFVNDAPFPHPALKHELAHAGSRARSEAAVPGDLSLARPGDGRGGGGGCRRGQSEPVS